MLSKNSVASVRNDPPVWLQFARDAWQHRGERRPRSAEDSGPGQESVCDYPRPPVVVPDDRSVKVSEARGLMASTDRSVRVLETSHPPAFYLPPESVVPGRLVRAPGSSHCEWKGAAEHLAVEGTTEPVGWRYRDPYPGFVEYAGWISFYPSRVVAFSSSGARERSGNEEISITRSRGAGAILRGCHLCPNRSRPFGFSATS